MWIGVGIFLMLTIVAGVLGFGGVAAVGAGFARGLFVVFFLLLLTSALLLRFANRLSPVQPKNARSLDSD